MPHQGNFFTQKSFLCLICAYLCRFKMEKNELLFQIAAIILRLGIKSVTMDDLARELGTSKKTLYAHFGDKRTMIQSLVASHVAHDKAFCEQQRSLAENAIDEMFRVTSFVTERIKEANPTFFYDLKNSYPKAFKAMQEYKWNYVLSVILENMHKGVAEGLYLDDLDADVVARVYLQNVDAVFGGELFNGLNKAPYQLFLNLFQLHMRGIVSEKGLKVLTKKIEDVKKI
jgi:AcrR family transcriptional regulator